jgi:hypothetical protein
MTNMERMLPLHEGKMGNQFDSRSSEFTGIGDYDLVEADHSVPDNAPLPRYWIESDTVFARLGRRQFKCTTALLGHRRVARSTDERTSIAAILPWGAVSYGWIVSSGPTPTELLQLCAMYNSFVFDYCLRNSLSQPSIPQGTSEQIPAISPEGMRNCCTWDSTIDVGSWVNMRVIELVFTTSLLAGFAGEFGDCGSPFRWDPARRMLLRAELDAAFFHLYGVSRKDVDYILDTFPIVKRKDEAKFGEYRTKQLILDVYDRMAEATVIGEPYRTILDPPAGHGPRHPTEVTT